MARSCGSRQTCAGRRTSPPLKYSTTASSTRRLLALACSRRSGSCSTSMVSSLTPRTPARSPSPSASGFARLVRACDLTSASRRREQPFMQANAILPVGTYGYDQVDLAFLNDRAAQFRDQVARRLSGDLSEDEFKPLRLMNGLYLQLHAYMLRVAIPYGVLSTAPLRRLAKIARIYDRGYGHFTPRQNIQFNSIKLEEAPDILARLAGRGMHTVQTSGNCILNLTRDQFSAPPPPDLLHPRVHAEIL